MDITDVDVVCEVEPSSGGERGAPLLDARYHPENGNRQ